MNKGLKGAAPLSVAGFQSAHISQSTAAHSTVNTITVSLKMFASLPAGANVLISGLVGVKSPSTNSTSVPIQIDNSAPDPSHALRNSSEYAGSRIEDDPTAFFASSASWTHSGGLLSFTLQQETDFNTFYIFSFQLENGAEGQESPPISINASDAAATFAVATFTTASDDGAILRIANFLDLDIFQSSALPSSINTITIAFSLNVALKLEDRATVVLSGFASVGDSMNSPFVITNVDGYNTTEYFGQTARRVGNNSLRLTVRNDTLPRSQYAFMFQVQNPEKGQDAVDIMIEVMGFLVTPVKMSPRNPTPTNAPLRVAGFRSAGIAQSTPCASAANRLTITLNFFITVPYTGNFSACTTSNTLPVPWGQI